MAVAGSAPKIWTAFLEKENRVMRKELEDSNFQKTKLETEIDILKKKLEQYQQFC